MLKKNEKKFYLQVKAHSKIKGHFWGQERYQGMFVNVDCKSTTIFLKSEVKFQSRKESESKNRSFKKK